jgi:ATP/maltotriose-dependent transcriptional regulator MalT
VALELWDAEAWHELAARQVRFARDTGALTQLRFALGSFAGSHILAGELTTAELMIDEERLIAAAIRHPAIPDSEMMLAAWRGEEARASELIRATVQEAASRGLDRFVALASYASSVLYNGLGRHDAACDAARLAFERNQMGRDPFVLPELADAASKTGDVELVRAALERLSEITSATSSEWAMGIEARVRAMLSGGEAAECLYRESISRLGRTRLRVELARSHLIYGEWLRAERRRADAREQLRVAHNTFASMGADAFAERARRELLATGQTADRRPLPARNELTAQESQIARLARDGLSNQEIGTRLFISTPTVKYHLRKVYTKLDVRSRNELDRELPGDSATVQSP